MSTSGVTTFSMQNDQVVNAALRKLAVLGDGQSPSTTQLSNGTQALNAMIKGFIVKGMPLWDVKEYLLTMTATRTYTFGIGQTVNIPAPLKVLQVIILDNTASSSRPVEQRTHYDYNLLSNTAATSPPTAYWYEPLNQTGILHIWPTPDTYTIGNTQLKIVYEAPFQDMVNSTDTLDFPQWWHDAIIFGLADRLAPEYGIPPDVRDFLKKEALYYLEEALSYGTEEGSIKIQPNWVTTGRGS